MQSSRLFPIAAVVAVMFSLAAASHEVAGLGPDEALRRLTAGNKRYVAAKPLRPHQARARRRTVAKGQHPFAIILGCADSRVPPEVVFDQGLGDLFVVRVAGNIADDPAVASIEYAVEHLGPRLILVLGHERCGAVDAAVKGGEAPGHLGSLVTAIAPAVESTREKPGDRLDNAVRANVVHVVEQLRSSEPILAAALKSGKVKIVGGRYDLDTGVVEILR